jgi:hypothetical protein
MRWRNDKKPKKKRSENRRNLKERENFSRSNSKRGI